VSYGSVSDPDVIEIADVVESFGLRLCHVGLLVVSWILLLCPSSMIMATPYVLGSLREEFGIDRAASALVGSAVTFGAVIGVLSFGRLHDLVGRKTAHLIAIGSICIFAALHLALPRVGEHDKGRPEAWYAFSLLILLRVMLGVLFAGPASFVALYFIEFLPSQLRGFLLTLCTAGWSFGTLYSIWVASTFQGQWRIVLAAPVPVCIVAVFALALLCPESPRWLYVVGRREDGHKVLTWVFSSRTIMAPVVPQPLLKPPAHVCVSKSENGKDISFTEVRNVMQSSSTLRDLEQLFSRKLRRTIFAAALMQMAVNGSSYAMLIWSAEILTQLLGVDHAPYELFVYGEIVGWIGTIVAACLLDFLGRQIILVAALSATAICTWGLSMVPRSYFWICTMFLFMQFVGGGIWPAMTAYTNECFPTSLRGTGGALVQSCGRFMAVFFPIVMGAVLDDKIQLTSRMTTLDTALTITACFSCIGAVGALLIPQETANAKMEDI
jgi:putative MFS transporter